ncbi:MAG TPA: hypothetical protein PLY93_03110 [Turneriella sp.]|nr:hypothetical protein [Turneriella sp.]
MGWILKLVLFSGVFNFFLHAQSYDIKTEKNILRSIEEALENGDNPTFTKKCDTLLNPHGINAFAYFLCGKHLLFVPEKDVQKAHAQAKKAYGRLKIAADDFAKTSKQTFYVLDAWQYMGLAAL